ncbi:MULTISPECIES: NosD domain-containing protein [Salinibaculum]|uniref:NosD domain-containing protein n=1 Tax=Salinibaculum TaxID=2732368 RepID=UPI0030D571FA
MRHVTLAAAAVVLALLVAASGFATGPAGGEEFSPVGFDETLKTGLTGVDVQQARAAGHVIPQAQVFYSQYQYVVGYYGIEALVTGLNTERRTEQFGQPLAIFVTDLSGTGPELTPDGFITLSDSINRGWVRAEDAWFVVGTPARTPGGPAVVPFGEREDADAFASTHDGEVVDWERLQSVMSERSDETRRLTAPVAEQQAWADRTVERARQVLDRPVSVVVGEDAPTLAAAVEQAPPNTTVEIPPGRYAVNLTVSKPLTLRGAGEETVLTGGGNGTVLTADAPRVGVTSLRITGVGDVGVRDVGGDNGTAWDRRIRLVYGYGDAAIRLADAHHSLVEDVTIETPANGVVALNSTGAVVREVTVNGSDTWEEGFMSTLAMYSKMVVEDSEFNGGRDAVYTHYADGVVVRDNRMEGMRYGLHEMYTSDALAANNTMRNTDAGIIVMTRPVGNVQVDNDVRDSQLGIATVGAESYTVNNTVVGNEIGISIGTSRSLYRGNTVVRNEVGIRSSTLLPTNDVTENDIVANDQPVGVELGTLNAWAVEGRGNYWGEIPGVDRDGDGIVDRTYRPTNPVDLSAGSSAGGHALAHSPTLGAIREFQQALPGLRAATVVDPAPLAAPAHPERLAALDVTTEDSP